MSRKKIKQTMTLSDAVTADDRSNGEDRNSFTIVSYKKQAATRSTTCAPAQATPSRMPTGKTDNKHKESKDTSSICTRGSVNKNGTLVTITTFGAFHYRIFPLIQKIVDSFGNREDSFIRKWRDITNRASGKVTATSSFRTVAKALGINDRDLYGYRQFIERCPTIKEFLTIQDAVQLNTSTAFTYILHEVTTKNYAAAVVEANSMDTTKNRPSLRDDSSGEVTIIPVTPTTEENGSGGDDVERNDRDETMVDDTTDPSNTEETDGETITTVATPSFVPKNENNNEEGTLASNQDSQYILMHQPYGRMSICYNNTGDFTTMMRALWPAIQDFLRNNPQHEHSKQWKVWITAGYTPDTDLAHAKSIFGLPTLDQIYLFLRDSPALQEKFEISWNHKIHYCPRDSLATPTRANIIRNEYPISSFVDLNHTPESFEPFHSAIFILLSTSNDMTEIQSQTWAEWIGDGLTVDNTLAELYDILQINSVRAYINIMYQFASFNKLVRITWTPEKDGFTYHIAQPSSDRLQHTLELPNLSHVSTPTEAVNIHKVHKRILQLEANITTINTISHFTQAREIQHTVKSFIQDEIRNLDKALRNKSVQFQEQIEQTVDQVIKDVYAAADEGYAAMRESNADIMQKITQCTQVITDFMPKLEDEHLTAAR